MHGMWWPRAGLSALAALLVLLIACAALELVKAQGGFVSIDCGAIRENTSANIVWTTDIDYTSLGSNAKTQVGALPPYDTLRYFPDKEVNKNCYVFDTRANFSYLIRAGFLYGNYDSLFTKEGLPSFALLFGANLWTNVTFSNDIEVVTHEMIALATSNTSSVCVGRFGTDTHNPFISSLEIRPLSSNQIIYAPAHENFLMKTNSRINFGQRDNNSVRFPDDEYDRIWESDLRVISGISTYNTTLMTNRTVSLAMTNDLPSSKVMQTARSPNTTESMSFIFTARFGPGQYYLAFYFAELDNSTSQQRIMDIHIDKGLSNEALNVANISGLYNAVELFDKNHTVSGGNYTLLLMPNKNSSRAPIINAAESYFLQSMARPTFDQDVQALEIIKSSFNLSIWMGDPCLPSVYKWPWLDCDSSGSETRVITLNLSSMNIRSEIPSALGNLSALISVDLHNNSLTGSVAASLANLRSLTYLDLSFNNLSGDYPAELNNLKTFRITGNPFICTTGSCIAAPTPAPVPGLVQPFGSDSRKSIGLIVGSVIAGIFVLAAVVLMCMLYKCQSQKKKGIFVARSAHWPPVPPFTEISKSVDSRMAPRTGGSHDVPIFSFADIEIITNNFQNKIAAEGSIGSLYYGTLADGQEVVVKLLQSNINQTPLDFLYKVTPLSYVTHKNLLRPIGFCAEIHHLMCIYEQVGKGSLYHCLHTDSDNWWLDWKTRVNILQQVAQGLEHLHHLCSPSIIHGNLTSTNVLLSGDALLVKVLDFGMHELSSNLDTNSGYLDPEYFDMKKFTEKSDVYSFGVLVLEVVCRRMPIDTSLPKDAWNIVQWVRKLYDRGDHELIVDAALQGTYNASTLSKVIKLALQATKVNACERPNMAELLMELKEVNKVEIGHHVVFAELDNSNISSGSDAPLSSTNLNGWSEEDVHK